jgi:L-asparagine transporter-like permease
MGFGPFIALAAMSKSLATLAGFVLVTAQVSLAAAERDQLPGFFARLRKGDTPALGLLVAAALGTLAAALTISPTLGQQFGVLIELSTLFALLTYAGACLAALRSGPPADRALGAIGAGLCAAMVAGSSKPLLALTAAFLAFFAILFFASRRALRGRTG